MSVEKYKPYDCILVNDLLKNQKILDPKMD